MNKKDTKSLCKWLKETLKEKVSDVETGERLIDSPVCIVGGDGLGWSFGTKSNENDAGRRRCHANLTGKTSSQSKAPDH
jgi:HSP90 family molecular chaperone